MYKTARIDLQGVQDYIKDNWKQIRCTAESTAAHYFTAFLMLTQEDPGLGVISWNAANLAHETISAWAGCSSPKVEYEKFFPEETARCLCVTKGGQLTYEKDLCLGAAAIQKIGDEWGAKRIIDQWIEGGTSFCKYEKVDGTISTQKTYRPQEAECFAVDWFITPQNGGACCGGVPDIPEQPNPPTPTPIIETDECIWTVQQIDVAVQNGIWEWKKYLVHANFSPCGPDFCYWESENGAVFDTDCNAGPPFGGGGGGQSCGCGLSAVTYTQNIGCTWNEEEQKYDLSIPWEVPQEDNGILGLAKRLDVIAQMIDVAGLIPYRLCNEKPEVEGDWVTIQWISDEASSDSPLRLRKRTRYRTKSGRSEPDLALFHSSFTWEAGPVCVIHQGSWWGVPQVWAKDADEGKRVIRHLALEAGLDPDQVGRWTTRVSDNPRYGRTGRMRVRLIEGIPWISSREGSDMLPMQNEVFGR